AHFVSEKSAVDIAVIETRREVSRTGNRCERATGCLREDSENTGLAGLIHRCRFGQLWIRVVVLHGELTGGTGGLFLTHLAFGFRHLRSSTARVFFLAVVELFLFLQRIL